MRKRISRDYVETQVQVYQELLGLSKWTVKIKYAGVEESDEAEVESDPDYYKATVRINLDEVTTKKALTRTIIHELIHTVLSPYTQMSRELVPRRQRKMLKRLEERLVSDIERWPLWG
jgi:hypothetical protein